MDCSLPGFSVQGILQARILEWVAMPPPGDFPDPGIEPESPALQEGSLLSEPPGKPVSHITVLTNNLIAYFNCLPFLATVHHGSYFQQRTRRQALY